MDEMNTSQHECTGESCTHESHTVGEESTPTPTPMLKKHYGNDEIALAFLLALTPLTVLTFFGQLGLI